MCVIVRHQVAVEHDLPAGAANNGDEHRCHLSEELLGSPLASEGCLARECAACAPSPLGDDQSERKYQHETIVALLR